MLRRVLFALCAALALVSFADPWDDERVQLEEKLKNPDPAKLAARHVLGDFLPETGDAPRG